MTPQQALRVIETELLVNEGSEDEAAREEALSVLWDFVLLGRGNT